jgi:hypothetical protein
VIAAENLSQLLISGGGGGVPPVEQSNPHYWHTHLFISRRSVASTVGVYFMTLPVSQGALCCSRKVAGSIPVKVIRYFNWPNPYSPGVNSASNRNEYLESSWRVAAGAKGWPHRHLPFYLPRISGYTHRTFCLKYLWQYVTPWVGNLTEVKSLCLQRNFLRRFWFASKSMRSHQLLSHSRNSKNFVEPEGSLPCSQEPSTGP